ncbi:hypothetical protein [Ulvibacterium marinum]|uniref:hypothetical protein n=1 Tax=Ulvibacterium marinum TaxID=2419782 RepID=UPI002493EF50|nr:hypothetical protein [Ulvibacterium marinum]
MSYFKNTSLQILLCFSMLCGYPQTQENSSNQKILGKLASYTMKHSPEKVYLHTDKHIYTNGETIWYKAYLVDGILHKPSSKSGVIHVELWDEKDTLIVRQKLASDRRGAEGSIVIPTNLKTGTLLIRAYTRFMLNERKPNPFQKEILVFQQEFGALGNAGMGIETKFQDGDSSSVRIFKKITPIVKFYPEGGDLVSGLGSVLGIKAVDQEGSGLVLQGTIQDTTGLTVGFFNTYDAGLGKVTFTPEPGMSYQATVSFFGDQYHFPLPKALSKGYILNIRNNGDHLILKVVTNLQSDLQGTFLVGHFRGDTFFERLGKAEDRNTYSVKLNTNRLANGIAHFTLFDIHGKPVCERLVFIDHPQNEVKMDIVSNSEIYGKREKVSLDISTLDASGIVLKSDFSLSVVTGSNQLPHRMADTNIKSWLLLNSDLGNSVEDASYFFEDNSRERKYVLDALMLTHGWRRFTWKDFLGEADSSRPTYRPEKVEANIVSGYTALTKNPNIRKPAKVLFRIPSLNILEQKYTDNHGNFSFGPYNLDAGEEIYLEIVESDLKTRKKKEEVSVYLDSEGPSPPIERPKRIPVKRNPQDRDSINTDTQQRIWGVKDYLTMAYQKKSSEFELDPLVTQLEEVEVIEKKRTEIEEIAAATLHGNAQRRIIPDSEGTAGKTVKDLIRESVSSPTFSLLYLNGSEVSPLSFGYVLNMDASEILYIDVLRGFEATIYGPRAHNGVIVIATKSLLSKGKTANDTPEYEKNLLSGFHVRREFFSPDYSFKSPEHKRPDFRTTLLWIPNLSIKSAERIPIEFYTGDYTGSFVVKVEGLTRDGRAFVGQKIFEVQN